MIEERLAELRINHNMTQEEFAERLDVSRQAVSKWELDKTLPDVNKLLKISELFQVSVDYLLKGAGGESVPDGQAEELATASLQCEEVALEEESTNDIDDIHEENVHTENGTDDQLEQNSNAKIKRVRVGLCVSLALVSILLLGAPALLTGCLMRQVWDKSDSERSLVKVEKIHTQYSLADVSSYGEDGVSVTKTVLPDANGVRNGDYIYCYTNAAGDKISVNYAAGTIIVIMSVSLILLSIWILLAREVRRK